MSSRRAGEGTRTLTDGDMKTEQLENMPRTRPKAVMGSGEQAFLFVIHRNVASPLHHDFRLEIEGAMKSWAVPHGPSMDPTVKRLAVAIDDQTVEEAVRAAGEGAILWDRGTYEWVQARDGRPVSPAEALAGGRLVLRLHGEKVSGTFALQRTGQGKKANWLLMKTDEDGTPHRRTPSRARPRRPRTDS